MSESTAVALGDRFVPDEYGDELEPNYYCRGRNAKRRKYCRNRAGTRTSHPGVGRCWVHGGKDDDHVKHGLHRRYQFKTDARARKLEHHAADPTPLDLSAELALSRVLLQEWLERENTDEADGIKLVGEVTRIVERIESIDAKNHITYAQLKRFLWGVSQVLEHYVTDKATLGKIKEALLSVRPGY
jgi:hypothetical protein